MEVTERAFEVIYKGLGYKLDKGTNKKEAEDTTESDRKETGEE
ncbi:hypothetical protein MHI19_16000 [Bacillus sp. FSL M7-1004]|uniref:Uncharacterized protein n=1 Tax=Bacillus subtilis subsp. subtilis TaxID=135461 RepID=A0ABD4A160_BACIU|nr:hypothetical protein [Bacillus subtilis]KIL34050.1 hypothetical protein B4067_3204 [Bacillus subtilis subsp. subtilis]KIN51784.1 hypothetical protein B4145_3092 [Bacillus subtilis]